MLISCPKPECVLEYSRSPVKKLSVRNGFYRRSSDSRKIQRYRCLNCQHHFSAATLSPCLNQKKRRINARLKVLLCSGVSQRRAAKILNVNRKTIVRRFRFLADESRAAHAKWLSHYAQNPLEKIQFDDLETSEHSKCKPLSVSLAVCPKDRKILSFQVSQMPANGLLARKAVKKYGHRKDERQLGWDALMKSLLPISQPHVEFLSDENPHYPRQVLNNHPKATHKTVKGARGCVAGQGELKKLGFDPLFALNHTCAMLRANLNRLFRRTWCTTKTRHGLANHLAIYTHYHNTVLTLSAG